MSRCTWSSCDGVTVACGSPSGNGLKGGAYHCNRAKGSIRPGGKPVPFRGREEVTQAQISQVDFCDVLLLKVELDQDENAADTVAAVAQQAKEILRFTCRVETVPSGTFSDGDRNILDTRTWE